MTLDKDSKELGVANRELAEAYVAVLNFKEALPFGLKALDIHRMTTVSCTDFAVAKDIMDVALGPQRADSIEACQNLSKDMAPWEDSLSFRASVEDFCYP
ncbi:hypothetical protein GH714_022789 [Hevea brasiliensis]|uniref:Uncharacterized protein n=1 Tax=Hevea brasiliensis TaxID=3981 RepID=A0A6A6KEN7_HEVBR|nr:hypothetical protein GH714_022789 [Hevea brasiliensis]